MDLNRDYFDYEVQRRDARVMAFDHTFKLCKKISRLNGDGEVFVALHTGLNEYEEIRHQALVQGEGHDDLRFSLEQMDSTLHDLNLARPKVVYTDKCCHDRSFYKSVFSSLSPKTNKTEITIPDFIQIREIFNDEDVGPAVQDIRLKITSTSLPVFFARIGEVNISVAVFCVNGNSDSLHY